MHAMPPSPTGSLPIHQSLTGRPPSAAESAADQRADPAISRQRTGRGAGGEPPPASSAAVRASFGIEGAEPLASPFVGTKGMLAHDR